MTLPSLTNTIVRRWTTGVMRNRMTDYETFARDVSVPMFGRATGCLGVLMAGGNEFRSVLTLWRSAEEVAAFEASQDYRTTVDLILARGFLAGEQTITCEPVHGGWLRP